MRPECNLSNLEKQTVSRQRRFKWGLKSLLCLSILVVWLLDIEYEKPRNMPNLCIFGVYLFAYMFNIKGLGYKREA